MSILIIVHLCCIFSFTGCDKSPEIKNNSPDVVSPIDMVSSKAEQEKYFKFIDSVEYAYYPSWSSVYYYGISKAVDEVSKIELKGLPFLIHKTLKLYNEELVFANGIPSVVLSKYYAFTAASIVRVKYDNFAKTNNYIYDPSEYYHTYWNHARKELPKVSASNMTDGEKIFAYREFGLFAAPYVIEEIEKGNAELEPFFALVGAHLSTAEYMHIIDITDPEKYTNTPPPTEEEIDAILLESVKDFDYKKWYEENEEDLDNLFKFLDAYCAEFEAEESK